jgi:hypothetical protein
MHVRLDAAGSNSLLSFMRQDTALVRRRDKFETYGEHHEPVAQWQEASRLEREQCEFESHPAYHFAHVDQRQESPPSKCGKCWFESNHGHHFAGAAHGDAAGLKPRLLMGSTPNARTNSRAISSAVERLFYMQDVGGSIPSSRTNSRP